MSDQSRRRTTFNEDATLYDQVRPGYPAAVFDDIVAFADLPPTGRILEIGCGTGQATVPFAERGFRIDCVELGENMAAVARRNLSAFPQVQVFVRAFEEWHGEQAAYDLVTSATAFHWIDPAVRYRKAAAMLRLNGTLALFWHEHVHTNHDRGFFVQVQAFYERLGPEWADPDFRLPHPDELATPEKHAIESSGLFGPVTVRRYVWEQQYDAESYIRVLNTYSDHRAMPVEQREWLFGSIRQFINEEFGGQIIKGYTTMLYLARKHVF